MIKWWIKKIITRLIDKENNCQLQPSLSQITFIFHYITVNKFVLPLYILSFFFFIHFFLLSTFLWEWWLLTHIWTGQSSSISGRCPHACEVIASNRSKTVGTLFMHWWKVGYSVEVGQHSVASSYSEVMTSSWLSAPSIIQRLCFVFFCFILWKRPQYETKIYINGNFFLQKMP